jgi:hypothetical protein
MLESSCIFRRMLETWIKKANARIIRIRFMMMISKAQIDTIHTYRHQCDRILSIANQDLVIPLCTTMFFGKFRWNAYLLRYVLEAGLADKRERQEEDIGASVAQWSEPIVIFLAYQRSKENVRLGIPESSAISLGFFQRQIVPRLRCFFVSSLGFSQRCLPAVSQRPRFTVLPSTTTLALKLSKTVGT